MLGFQFISCTVVMGLVFDPLVGSDSTIESLQMIFSIYF